MQQFQHITANNAITTAIFVGIYALVATIN
jgi:hypothetical protein